MLHAEDIIKLDLTGRLECQHCDRNLISQDRNKGFYKYRSKFLSLKTVGKSLAS
jgi:hypothetical protein